MCTVLSAISAGASLVGGIAQSRAVEAQGRANADALEANARTARFQAHDSIERGGLEELRLRRNLSQLSGNQRVQAATSGIDINSGSVRNVINSSIAEGEQDAETIRFNAARQRWGYLQQANNLTNQANSIRANSRYQANNILFGNLVNFGLGLGESIYNHNNQSSPLTDTLTDDRSKYFSPRYALNNPYYLRARGYSLRGFGQ